MSEKVRKTLNKASESYSDQIMLRVAVGAIPLVGSILDTLLSGAGAKLRQRRIERFLGELSSRLEGYEAVPAIDEESLYDLVMYAIEESARTRKRNKIELFANIIMGYIVDSRGADEVEMGIRVISQLDDIHFEMLRFALEAPKCGSPFSGLRVVSIGKPHEEDEFEGTAPLNLSACMHKRSSEMIRVAASELVSKALLVDEGIGRLDARSMNYFVATDTARWVRELVLNRDFRAV